MLTWKFIFVLDIKGKHNFKLYTHRNTYQQES